MKKINEVADLISKNRSDFVCNLIYNLGDELELSPNYNGCYGFRVKTDEIEFNSKKYNSILFVEEDLLLGPKEKDDQLIALLDVLIECNDKSIITKILKGIKNLFEIANVGSKFEDTINYVVKYYEKVNLKGVKGNKMKNSERLFYTWGIIGMFLGIIDMVVVCINPNNKLFYVLLFLMIVAYSISIYYDRRGRGK